MLRGVKTSDSRYQRSCASDTLRVAKPAAPSGQPGTAQRCARVLLQDDNADFLGRGERSAQRDGSLSVTRPRRRIGASPSRRGSREYAKHERVCRARTNVVDGGLEGVEIARYQLEKEAVVPDAVGRARFDAREIDVTLRE